MKHPDIYSRKVRDINTMQRIWICDKTDNDGEATLGQVWPLWGYIFYLDDCSTAQAYSMQREKVEHRPLKGCRFDNLEEHKESGYCGPRSIGSVVWYKEREDIRQEFGICLM